MSDRKRHERHATTCDTDLVEDVDEVDFDRPLGYPERLGDLLVAVSLAELGNDLPLARRQFSCQFVDCHLTLLLLFKLGTMGRIKSASFTLRWWEKCACSLLLPHHLQADIA